MGRLLAKKLDERIKNTEELYLIPHLKAVESVGDLLSKSVGKKILYSVGLDSSIWEERLKVILPLSCLLHDLGKANDWFQSMIRNNTSQKIMQPIRHEFLSVILILRSEKKIRNFILKRISSLGSDNIELLINSMYSGILAHHLKMDRELKQVILTLIYCLEKTNQLMTLNSHFYQIIKTPSINIFRITLISFKT